MRWQMLILILFSLFGLSFADGTDVYLAIFPVCVVIVAIILGILNMAAETFSLPGLSAYVKTELGELVSGVVLALIVYAFVLGTSQVLPTLLVGQSATNAALDYIHKEVSLFQTTYWGIIRIGTQLKAMVSFSTQQVLPAGWVSWAHSISPYPGLAPLLSILSMAVQGVSNNILLYQTLYLLLQFCSAIIPTIILPVALSMRLLPITRQAGTAVVAICISLIVIFPWSVVFVQQIHSVLPYQDPTIDANGGDVVGRIINTLGVHFPLTSFLNELCQNNAIRLLLSLNEQGTWLLFCTPICAIVAAVQAAACLTGYAGCFLNFFMFCWSPIEYMGTKGYCYNIVTAIAYPIMVGVSQIVYNIGAAFMNVPSEKAGEIYDVMYPFMRDINNMVMMGYVDAMIIGIFTIVGSRSISAALGGEWYMIKFQRLV